MKTKLLKSSGNCVPFTFGLLFADFLISFFFCLQFTICVQEEVAKDAEKTHFVALQIWPLSSPYTFVKLIKANHRLLIAGK